MSVSRLRTALLLSRSGGLSRTRTNINMLATTPALRTIRVSQSRRNIVTIRDHIYFATATASGPGRSGHVISEGGGDAPLELDMAPPRATGGSGKGHNPEQLLALGYSSCFLGALQLCASKAGKPHAADDAKVHVNVYLGRPEPKEAINGNGNGLNGGVTNGNGNGGNDGPALGLRVGLCVEGVDDDGIIQAAHATCPFSSALTEGIKVEITKA